MAKEDLTNSQSVADGDLKDADSVNQQGLDSAGSADQQNQDVLADGTSKDKPVTYADVEKAVQGRKAAEEIAAQAQRDLEIMQQVQQMASQQNTAQTAGTTYEQAMLNLGLTADDMYDGTNNVNVNVEKSRLDGIVNQQQQAFNVNQQFVASHSDFSQVVGSVNPSSGQIISLTSEAQALVQRKPYLANASYQAAYEEVLQARKLAELEKTSTANEEHLNRQNADNATAPMGGSAAGGGGSEQNHSIALMSREQVEAEETKIANGDYD